jgi:hypothetical protein
MTAHGPEALRIVTAALDEAGVGLDVPAAFLVDLTGTALDVIESPGTTREDAIEVLVADHDLARPFVTKALDLAVEALTANPQE